MASDPLNDAQVLIKRANRNIKLADRLVHNYIFGKPYAVVVERNGATDNKIARLRFLSDIPDEADEAVHNVFQNLHSVLDYIAWAVANKTGPPAKPKSVSFPIYKDAAAFMDAGEQRKIEKIGGKHWVNFLAAQKPYDGGDALLAALDAANNVKKHRRLMRIANVPRSGRISGTSIGGVMGFNVEAFLGPLYDGMVLTTVSNSQADPEVALTISVALGEIPGFERQPFIVTLRAFRERVERVLVDARRTFFT